MNILELSVIIALNDLNVILMGWIFPIYHLHTVIDWITTACIHKFEYIRFKSFALMWYTPENCLAWPKHAGVLTACNPYKEIN
jgi:hypothetical protein